MLEFLREVFEIVRAGSPEKVIYSPQRRAEASRKEPVHTAAISRCLRLFQLGLGHPIQAWDVGIIWMNRGRGEAKDLRRMPAESRDIEGACDKGCVMRRDPTLRRKNQSRRHRMVGGALGYC
jgi:hypothetical protein